MRTLIITSLLLLASCAPKITSAGPDSVTLMYEPAANSEMEIHALADEYCARSGRVARVLVHEENVITRPTISYECVEP